VIYSGKSFQQESALEFISIFYPIIFTFVIGALLKSQVIKISLVQIEWVLHLLITSLSLILLLLLQSDDKLSSFLPFTWSLYIWVVLYGLVLISGLSINIGRPPIIKLIDSKRTRNTILLINMIIWPFVLLMVYSLSFSLYFWIFALIFHSMMIPISIHSEYRNRTNTLSQEQIFDKKLILNNIHGFFRTSSILLMFLFSWIIWNLNHNTVGPVEESFYLVFEIFISPLFYLGIALAVSLFYLESKSKGIKKDITLIGDLICVACLFLALIEIYIFPPLILGIIISYFFFFWCSKSPFKNARNITAIQISWVAGIAVFAFFSTLSIHLPLIGDLLLQILFFSLILLIVLSFLTYMMVFLRDKRKFQILERIK